MILKKYDLAVAVFDKGWNNCELNAEGEKFVKTIEKKIKSMDKNYIPIIKSLLPYEQKQGISWLLHIQQQLSNDLMI